jgi:hypothetical protein
MAASKTSRISRHAVKSRFTEGMEACPYGCFGQHLIKVVGIGRSEVTSLRPLGGMSIISLKLKRTLVKK